MQFFSTVTMVFALAFAAVEVAAAPQSPTCLACNGIADISQRQACKNLNC